MEEPVLLLPREDHEEDHFMYWAVIRDHRTYHRSWIKN